METHSPSRPLPARPLRLSLRNDDFRFAEPMRRDCTELTQAVVPSGHRMAQKQPIQVNAALAEWLAAKAPDAWLGRRQATGALASGANTASTRTAYGDRSRKWRDATVKECTSNEVTMTSVIELADQTLQPWRPSEIRARPQVLYLSHCARGIAGGGRPPVGFPSGITIRNHPRVS